MLPIISRAIAHLKEFPWLIILPIAFVVVFVGSLLGWQYQHTLLLQQQITQLDSQNQKQLYEAHLQLLAQKKAEGDKLVAQNQLTQLKSDAAQQQQVKLATFYQKFSDLKTKVDRNNGVKLDTSSTTNQYATWGVQLLNQQYDQASQAVDAASADLDKQYQTYLASIAPKPTALPANSSTGQSSGGSSGDFTKTTASTSRGNFTVSMVKIPLSQVIVKTVSDFSGNCSNNCPTQSLSQYVNQSGAFAGINGTYFCPPDYSSCVGKVNTFDFAFYNSLTGSWLNQNALGWNSEGLATFNGHSALFYHLANQYDGHSVTAAIANFPTLLVQNGQVLITDSDLDSAQLTKGLRGALGVGNGYVYIAVVSGASITDAAYAMQSLGATDVLNLDGGGSSALYVDGSYKVGPGRSLPNAVVLVRG